MVSVKRLTIGQVVGKLDRLAAQKAISKAEFSAALIEAAMPFPAGRDTFPRFVARACRTAAGTVTRWMYGQSYPPSKCMPEILKAVSDELYRSFVKIV